jgi:hypothetical protein
MGYDKCYVLILMLNLEVHTLQTSYLTLFLPGNTVCSLYVVSVSVLSVWILPCSANLSTKPQLSRRDGQSESISPQCSFYTMFDLCVPSDDKLQDVLSVPAPFSIAPSGHLSVTELLLLNLHTVLENDTLATRIKFSKKSPSLELPTDFTSQPVP